MWSWRAQAGGDGGLASDSRRNAGLGNAEFAEDDVGSAVGVGAGNQTHIAAAKGRVKGGGNRRAVDIQEEGGADAVRPDVIARCACFDTLDLGELAIRRGGGGRRASGYEGRDCRQ
jgi:hypothetical protein